jgi:DNA-directed RNA polymerase subunit RPC12/RpoP
MAKYRKKPVVVEAVQWTGKNFEELAELIGSLEEGRPERRAVYDELDMTLKIKTLEGVMAANPGDYIIQGVQGELYPCKPDIFEATYEPLESAKTYVCDGCGKVYVREGRKPARGRNNFCPECGDKASKRLWARKKATEKEKKEEAWNSALPPKICRS